jgi:hypothetical protein
VTVMALEVGDGSLAQTPPMRDGPEVERLCPATIASFTRSVCVA